MIMAFSSLAEIDAYMKTNKCEFWEAVIREEARDSQPPPPEWRLLNVCRGSYMNEPVKSYGIKLTAGVKL
jgi:hypothetical protein